MADLIHVLDERAKQKRPALFVAVGEGIRSDAPGWRITATVIAEVARSEREAISYRVTNAQRVMKLNGRWRGGTTPYGYMSADNPNGQGRILVPCPEEVAIVQEVYRRVLSGEPPYRISVDLNRRGIRPRKADTWTVTSLRQVLIKPTLIGQTRMHGEVMRGDDGYPLVQWEPIVSVKDHARVCELLEPKSKRERRRKAARLLSGLLQCDGCGKPLYVQTPDSKRPHYQLYRCSSVSNARALCGGTSISAKPIEDYFAEYFLSQWGNEPVRVREVVDPQADRRAAVEAAIKEITSRLQDVDDDEEADKLFDTLSSLRADRRTMKETARVEGRWVDTGQTFQEVWDGGGLHVRQQLIRNVITLVSVKPGKRGRTGFQRDRIVVVGKSASMATDIPGLAPNLDGASPPMGLRTFRAESTPEELEAERLALEWEQEREAEESETFRSP